jgi:hypothetical protein
MNKAKLSTAIQRLKCRQNDNPESLQEALQFDRLNSNAQVSAVVLFVR